MTTAAPQRRGSRAPRSPAVDAVFRAACRAWLDMHAVHRPAARVPRFLRFETLTPCAPLERPGGRLRCAGRRRRGD